MGRGRTTSPAALALAALALAALALAACGGRSAGGNAGSSDAGAADAANDLARDVDVVPPDADTGSDTGCDEGLTWSREPRTIESVALVDDISRFGVTERLLVDVELRSSCEELAGIDVTLTPGGATDFIGLRAYAWVPQGIDCLPSAPVAKRVVSIPGRQHGNPRVTVTDDSSPGGGVRLNYDRDTCSGVPDCQCGLASPPGDGEEWAACVTDCSCAEGLSCIGFHGLAGTLWNCAQVCSDFMDCDARETCLPPIPDGAPYVCSLGGDLCLTDDDCPRGFTCTFTGVANYCADEREGPTARECRCDTDCPDGHLCVQSAPRPVCEMPCLASSWCPETPFDELICLGQICQFTD